MIINHFIIKIFNGWKENKNKLKLNKFKKINNLFNNILLHPKLYDFILIIRISSIKIKLLIMAPIFIRQKEYKIILIDKKKLKIFNNLYKVERKIHIHMYGMLKKDIFHILNDKIHSFFIKSIIFCLIK